MVTDLRDEAMHPLITISIVIGIGAVVFWAALALVDRLQRGKKKNSPKLDPGPDEGQNLDGPAD